MSIIIPATREEWLEERKKGLGGSDAAAAIGRSKWKTNSQLWAEKTGHTAPPDISGKPQVQYGHDAEEHLRALFSLDHPELKVTYESPYKMIFSDAHPFMFATPDGELEEIETGRKGGLEIKTTEIMQKNQWDLWNNRIPDEYYCQVLHQMYAADWEFVWLRAQIKWRTRDGELRIDTREYLIEREEHLDDMEEVVKGETILWEYVATKTAPPLILPEI